MPRAKRKDAKRRVEEPVLLDNGSVIIRIWIPREDAETLLEARAAKGLKVEPEVSEVAAWALHLQVRRLRRYLRKRGQTPGARAIQDGPRPD